jgi:prevent-host-death family protein
MGCMSARDAKNSFGKLIDIARAEPVVIEKHGRPVVVVLSIESYEQLRFGCDQWVSIAGERSIAPATRQVAASKTLKQLAGR